MTAPRSDGLPGGISHSIIDRCSEGRPLVSTEDPRSVEDLCNCLEFRSPWTRNSLDSVSWGGGDAQVSQRGGGISRCQAGRGGRPGAENGGGGAAGVSQHGGEEGTDMQGPLDRERRERTQPAWKA
jgi:hypothetical protein